MRYSKHELSTTNMLYSLKNCYITPPPLPPYNGHLSKTATFFCPHGSCCREVCISNLYLITNACNVSLVFTLHFTVHKLGSLWG